MAAKCLYAWRPRKREELLKNPREPVALRPPEGFFTLRPDYLGRARFASEEGAPNEDTALTRGTGGADPQRSAVT